MRLLKAAILVALYAAGFALVSHLVLVKAASDFTAGRGREVVRGDQVPPEFPVLLVWQTDGVHHAKIVSHLRLSEELRSHKCSFLVPRGKADALRREVASEGSFESQALPGGGQALRVTHTWHGGLNHESGWYIADRKGITPKYYLSYMEGSILFNDLPMLLIAYTALWAVGLILYRGHARRKHGSI